MVRYIISIVSGVAVTFGLLFLMQFLIETGESALTDPQKRYFLDFVRVKKQEIVNVEEPKPEKPPKPQQPPPDTPPPSQDDIDPNAPAINVRPPSSSTDVSISGPGSLSYTDGEYLPIVRVAPIYPSRALSRGIEGYVDLEFTVTTAGTVKDPVVIYSTSSLFNRAAMRAVLKFKYKPRVVDGQPVEVPGVKTRIRFELED
ncbi:energy transducer TonB [Lentisalinibacter orientalis]|uniref:energy transducer TonB n=1 Tax=Lentisalinibacter orientalis TaxID=2992241 RepID=UPI0038666794